MRARLAIVMALGALAWGAVGPAMPAHGQTAIEPSESPDQYPAGQHRDETFYACTSCHGFKLVAAQGMSRERWDDSLTWMSEKQNMPRIEGEPRARILDYLSTVFPERKGQGGFKSPFAPN
jgi:hypothetical protein